MRVQLIRYHDGKNINTRLAKSLNERQGVVPPLGLAYLAAALLKAGHQVQVIDAIAEALSPEQVKDRIHGFKPQVVGITAMTPVIHGALEATAIAKSEKAAVVLGGPHLAAFPRETLSFDTVDYGILGEGEDTLVELCAALDGGKPTDGIAGLAFKREKEVVLGAPRIVTDLDRLPFPAYHLLPMSVYNSIIGLHPVSTMMGSRGCPYKCGYCFKTPSDQRMRFRKAESIVEEMNLLAHDYHVREIMFYDDCMPPRNVRALCAEILKRKLKLAWESPQRVDLIEMDLFPLMKKAGCRMLRFGVEQGTPEQLALIEKHITLKQVCKAFNGAKSAGIDTFAYFIIGYANETPASMAATIKLAKELNPRYVMFTKAVPMPHTNLMDLAVEKGLAGRDYWRRFTLGEDVPAITPFVPDADEWVRRAYREFYLRPGKILEQFFRIRSYQDLRKNISGFIGLVKFKNR